MRHPRIAGTLLWVVQILAALAFLIVGFGKFRNPFWIRSFAQWGYSDSFRILIGVVEMAGGALLALPRTASYAAALICTVMIGAAATLLLHHEPAVPPLFWLAVIAMIGFARRRRAWRPAARGVPVTEKL